MSDAVISVVFAGLQVSVQDGGRPRLMRYGIPGSGPMDRLSFAAANLALGNPADAPGFEVSVGGLTLECLSGIVGFAVAGGGFAIEQAGRACNSWSTGTLHGGDRLTIRPGTWGSWCYLAFAGDLLVPRWLESASTHGISGLGGGVLTAGQKFVITNAGRSRECACDIPFPHMARPRHDVRVTLGPQERFFDEDTVATFAAGAWRMTAAWDRMGVRLQGPAMSPNGQLDMPSEPVVRGSIQVAGDGVPTVLLADHPTTGGYPKIATVLDCDLDAFVQLRVGDWLSFHAVGAGEATRIARNALLSKTTYFGAFHHAAPSRQCIVEE